MAPYQLVSFNLCPYVQRSAIALEEKAVPYTIDYIDLSAKPQWFLDLSPLGKVPLLRVGDRVLFESAVINEFIDETAGGPRLHPEDPLERAYDRAWIEFTSVALADCYRLMLAADQTLLLEQGEKVREKLARFERELKTGPYFHEERFSLVDCAVAPLLQRLQWCEAIAPELALFDATPKTLAWSDSLLERPSVQRSTIPEIREVFMEYLQGAGSPTRQVDPSYLGQLIASQQASS
jgi:glutathione S-transferase